jgi:hypothetical protein
MSASDYGQWVARRRAGLVVALVVLSAAATGAQRPRTFTARLSPVALDVAMQATISGSGEATATLTGKTLAVTGRFVGLKSPATIAQLHIGRKGVRGPAALDLTVSHDTAGTLSGSFQLTDTQIAALGIGAIYVQIHSEKAPDGNLWGWLLEPETKK